MGKRKRSSDEDYDYIAKKIKKLLKRRRRRRDSDVSEASDVSRNAAASPICTEDIMLEEQPPNTIDDVVTKEHGPTTSTVVAQPVPATNTAEQFGLCEAKPTPESAAVPELDSEIMAILGDDPSVTTVYGKDIQPQLAVRLQHIATMGLSKETRKELQDKYLPPGNCSLIDAPQLNPEIKAAVSEAIVKRDKGIEVKQKQICCATSSIAEALTVLLAEENKNKEVIKLLMDASRLLCDCQYTDSITRRNFVLFNLKKEMKDQMQKTNIDKFLFGTNLAETLKTAKSISKSGAELKQTPATKAPATKPKSAAAQPAHQRNNLNWKAPPPSRRPKGTPRKEPAYRSSHASFSRPSQRAPPPAHSRTRR